MTSVNVTYYQVYKAGKFVKEHRQHHYCTPTIRTKLAEHQPPEDFMLVLRYPDEEEVDHFSEQISLADYLNGKEPVWDEQE